MTNLAHLSDVLQSFANATGYKSLLRRLAEGAQRLFATEQVVVARISGRSAKLELKPRVARLTEGTTLTATPPEILATLTSALRNLPSIAELRDGAMRIATDAGPFTVALLDDPRYRGGTLIAWPETAAVAADPSYRMLADLVVRQGQSEARWYRKMDKTQALLYRDDLTGLFNTRYFEVALDAELRRASRFATQFCLLFIDLDGFKPINDKHGHPSGSSVLRQVADVLRDSVREVDIPLRWGGDEFVIVLLGATSAKGLLAAERIRRRIEQKEFRLEDGGTARLTASIGVAAYPEHGQDRATLLRMADETMYNSKRNGKNRVTIVGGPSF